MAEPDIRFRKTDKGRAIETRGHSVDADIGFKISNRLGK
jgi:hypothetical protein